MTPDEFRQAGAEVVEWIARYMEQAGDYPVLSTVDPGEVRANLPPSPPRWPEPFADVLADMDRVVMPGITHWQSPDFFAFFPANASGPSILGELLSAGLGVQGMLWATSPACTELETHVLDWMVELCGLPDRFGSDGAGGGVIQDSASSALLVALLAARERAGGAAVLGRLRAYTSSHAHSSVEKGARIAGLSAEQLTMVGVGPDYAMDATALGMVMDADRAAGLIPFFVAATAGTTSSNAFDPVADIAAVAATHGAWVHVDGAMSGSAAVAPEFRFVNDGLDRVDSYCFNPHKWLFTNFDCDCFFVADRQALIDALSILPEYLRNRATESGAVIDYRDWQIPLGRRFRALKLWFVLRHYGVEGLRHHVREHVALSQEFAGWVEASPQFVLAAPTPLNLVSFRHRGGDAVNEAIRDRLNESGELYLTHTVLDGHVTLRMSIGALATQREHVERAWRRIEVVARSLAGSDPTL